GPGGFSMELTESASLSVVPGEYSVTAGPLRVAGTLVDSILQPTIDSTPVTVTSEGEATVTVQFARRPGSGMIWVVSAESNEIMGFSDDQLVAGSGITPAVVLSPAEEATWSFPAALAFDGEGNLWVAACDEQLALLKYSAEQLSTTG